MTPTQAIQFVTPYLGKYHLRLDCNQKWTLQEALFFANHFKKTDFEYLEEPVPTKDLPSFIEKTNFPIAVDESFRKNQAFCQTLPVQAIIVKPTLSGFIPRFHAILSSSYESSIGLLQIARHADPHSAHGLDTFDDLQTSLLSPSLKRENGYLIWEGSDTPIDFSKLCLIAP